MILHAVSFWFFLTHDLLHPLTGPSSAQHGGYLWWSGIAGSFILGGGIWTGAFVTVRRHQCHARWCLRVGRHPAADGKYVLCHRHHPDVPNRRPSAQHIAAEHVNGRVNHDPETGHTTSDDNGTW